MSYEVELKFPVDDFTPLVALLNEFGAEPQTEIAQRDRYFNHPCRDFAETDEAFRVRTIGDEQRVTYKGPLVDEQTKTRREIELAIGEGPRDAPRVEEMLTLLGFRPVREVAKTRVSYALEWEDRDLEVCLDQVDGLGRYVEIETAADEAERDEARDSILRFAGRLGLKQAERRSYLQLLLEKDGAGG